MSLPTNFFIGRGGSVIIPGGESVFTSLGSNTWVAPADVTAVSVVAIGSGGSGSIDNAGGGGGGGGLGWKNSIAVTPGQSYTVFVGAGQRPVSSWESIGNENPAVAGYHGQDSYFISLGVVGGQGGGKAYDPGSGVDGRGGAGGGYSGDGGGFGGIGGTDMANRGCSGGGGAGGYSGNGGIGAGNYIDTDQAYVGVQATAGAGGGGGGGGALAGVNRTFGGGSGGGVGLYGAGSSGAAGTTYPDMNGNYWAGSGMPGSGAYSEDWNNYQNAHGYPGSGGVRDVWQRSLSYSYISYNGADLAKSVGGSYGSGGGGSNDNSPISRPGNGAVRIIWGTGRGFPSSNTAENFSEVIYLNNVLQP